MKDILKVLIGLLLIYFGGELSPNNFVLGIIMSIIGGLITGKFLAKILD